MPLTIAQATDSRTSTSGSAGVSGGVLPVAAGHVVSTPFFARATAVRPAASDITDQIFEEPSAMAAQYPGRQDRSVPHRLAERGERERELLGTAGRDQPVRRRVGRIGD